MHRALTIVEILEEIVHHLPSYDLLRVMRTCRAFYHPALDSLWQHRQNLNALVSLLPDDLVVSESLADLRVFSSTLGELLFPLEQIAVLPHSRRIRGVARHKKRPSTPLNGFFNGESLHHAAPVESSSEPGAVDDANGDIITDGIGDTDAEAEDHLSERHIQLSSLSSLDAETEDHLTEAYVQPSSISSFAETEDYPSEIITDEISDSNVETEGHPSPEIAHFAFPAAPHLGLSSPDQHVMIFERAPSEDDISQMLKRTRRCSRLRYGIQDYKDYLVFHALEQYFPNTNFFPKLREIVLTIPPRNYKGCFPVDSYGLLVPFAFMRRISTLTIEDPNVKDGTANLFINTHAMLGCSLSSLPVESFENMQEVVYSTRWMPTDVHSVHGSDCNSITDANIEDPVTSGHFGGGSAVQNAFGDEHFGPYNAESLHEYILRTSGPSVTIPRSFYDFLGHLGTSLRSLKLPATPPPRFWELCSRIPLLEELELGQSWGGVQIINSGRTDWPNPAGTGVIDIGSLRRLTCRGHAIKRDLFQVFVSYRLLALDTLTFEAPECEPDVKHIFSILENVHHHAPLLRHLSIDLRYSRVLRKRECRRRDVVSFDTLTSLRNMSDLEYLHVICPPSQHLNIELANSDVLRMANAWPKIRHLFLDPAHSPDSTVTLEGLIPLAEHCRHLTEVGIGLDAKITHIVYTSAMYVHELSAASLQECPVTTLDLGAPRVHNTAACAEFLRCIFPSLEDVRLPADGQCDHGRTFAWSKVARFVKELGSTGVIGGDTETQEQVVFDDNDDDYYMDSEDEENDGDELSI